MEKYQGKTNQNLNPTSKEERKPGQNIPGSSGTDRPGQEEEYRPGQNPHPEQNPSPKPGEFQDRNVKEVKKDIEKKNTAEAPSKEDWEGGGSRPQAEVSQEEEKRKQERQRSYSQGNAGKSEGTGKDIGKQGKDFEQEDEGRSERAA